MLVSISEAALICGVSVSTMRRWDKEGVLHSTTRTLGNHRRYSIKDVKIKLGLSSIKDNRISVGYGRVSSNGQKEDLSRQLNKLENYLQTQNRKFEVISDLGSGLNYKKKGLKRLFKLITSFQIAELVITHKDRLLRFGSEILFYLCKAFDVKVTILEESKNLTDEEKLSNDVIELMVVFSARLYGKRGHKNRIKKAV